MTIFEVLNMLFATWLQIAGWILTAPPRGGQDDTPDAGVDEQYPAQLWCINPAWNRRRIVLPLYSHWDKQVRVFQHHGKNGWITRVRRALLLLMHQVFAISFSIRQLLLLHWGFEGPKLTKKKTVLKVLVWGIFPEPCGRSCSAPSCFIISSHIWILATKMFCWCALSSFFCSH